MMQTSNRRLISAWRGCCCAVALVASSVVVLPGTARAAAGDAADKLQTLPDFKIELVTSIDKGAGASWISLQNDSQGRLLLGGQRGQSLTRITLKDGKIEKQETIKLPVSELMGVLDVDGYLYVDGNDGKKAGLFRLKDRGDGTFDPPQLLREWQSGSGEHGAHGVVLGPDKKLYTVCGNFVGLPTDLEPSSPHRNYADDLVLPRAEDGNGFGAGKKPPGGFITRMDLDGKHAELFASGERNTYDIAFNADGELFGFDSDMEWDWGTPWYRPIRVFHAASGADQGFREGSAKWPEYYADSLPAAVTIGIGCPTGVSFGYGAKFPAKYQKAYYILDWTYGRIIATHLKPDGASYTGTWENFVAPKGLSGDGPKAPNNVTDIVIGADGALYFTTGGRGTQAQLFRVTYTGKESTAPADTHDADGAEARALRHKLEAFHGHEDAKAIETAWPHLGDADRFIRYAARLAIESQPVAQWKEKALAESKPEAAMTALLAVARLGGKDAETDLFKSLAKFPISSLAPAQQLEKIRVIEVAISRDGKPSAEQAQQIIAELDPIFPAKGDAAQAQSLNRELCQVLLALGAPDATAKTVKLLEAAPTQEEQLVYVLALRTIQTGWTPELRRTYFGWWNQDHSGAKHPDYVLKWFAEAGRPFGDGSSYNNFINHFHEDAVKALSADDQKAVADVLAAYVPVGGRKAKPAVKVHAFVKAWKMSDLEPQLAKVSKGRSFKDGKQAFEAAQCAACHKFGNEGGAIGPDLTAISARFTRRDILESIVDPSKVISEQYANTTVRTNDGDAVEGRILEETPEKIVIRPNPLDQKTVTIKKSDVKSKGLSKLSPMPEGLINNLSETEILDLIAYLESGGKPNHADFKK